MAITQDLDEIILEMVEQTPDCDMEELAARCPQATWNQVFLVLDNLSRAGQVMIQRQGPGRYKVGLAPQRPFRSQVLSQQQA